MNRLPKQQNMLSIVNASVVPPSFGQRGPFPQTAKVNHRYFERFQVAGAVSFVVVDFRINSIWQPRSGGPTGTTAGYISTAFRYGNYRVEDLKLRIQVNSNEPGIPLSFGVVMSDVQPSTAISTYAMAETVLAGSAVYFKGTVGETSGMSRYVSPLVTVSPAHILGNPLEYFADRDFTGTYGTPVIAVPIPGTNPNQAIWASFILLSDNAVTPLTNGAFLDWDAELMTRAFSLLPLN
jgi:hypothetical protein